MSVQPRPELAGVHVAAHGGLDYAELLELGVSPDEILDFSVNINPALPPRELLDVLARVEVSTYPDTESRRLRQIAAEHYGVTPEHVLAGNGSSELIWLICLAFLSPSETVLLRQPTFGEYEVAARIHGAEVVHYQPAIPPAIRARLAFICNPNNPTGDYHPLPPLHSGTLFVVDEAYADFVAGRPSAICREMPSNLIVLRSLTKFSGLAGLRLGLAFAQPEVIRELRKVKPPWNVNAMAQAAGEYALRHPDLLPDLESLAAARDGLQQGLRALGLDPRATDCNYFLVPLAGLATKLPALDGGAAASVRRALLGEGILVRDCTSFGLPDTIRVSVRGADDCRKLLRAVEQLTG